MKWWILAPLASRRGGWFWASTAGATLRSKCSHLGFELTKDELDGVYNGFIEIADRKKGVTDAEISALIHTLKAGESVRSQAAD